MERVSVYAAKARLSELLDRAAKGEEIVITRHGRPIVKLLAAGPGEHPRELGRLRGRIRVKDDFDAPLPEGTLESFEGGQ